ncbi:MAG: class I SAM-dependent methyltransferase, partial [Parafilimonas terrae]|nr:class I SAM-dependent methyltransferase [Parafilimonas terrae]
MRVFGEEQAEAHGAEAVQPLEQHRDGVELVAEAACLAPVVVLHQGEALHRHVADALQLLSLMPDARSWLDLGSGAGIPGLILAIAGRERGIRVSLVE